jgi:hypothetical protein
MHFFLCLSFYSEPLTSLGCPLNAVFPVTRVPRLQDARSPLLSPLQKINLSIISIAMLEIVSPTEVYRKLQYMQLQNVILFSVANPGRVTDCHACMHDSAFADGAQP